MIKFYFNNFAKNRKIAKNHFALFLRLTFELFLKEDKITQLRTKTGAKSDTELSGDNCKVLTEEFKAIYRRHKHQEFPETTRNLGLRVHEKIYSPVLLIFSR